VGVGTHAGRREPPDAGAKSGRRTCRQSLVCHDDGAAAGRKLPFTLKPDCADSNSAHHECCTWCVPAPHHSFQPARRVCSCLGKSLQIRWLMREPVTASSRWIRGVPGGLWTWPPGHVLFAGDWFERPLRGSIGSARGLRGRSLTSSAAPTIACMRVVWRCVSGLGSDACGTDPAAGRGLGPSLLWACGGDDRCDRALGRHLAVDAEDLAACLAVAVPEGGRPGADRCVEEVFAPFVVRGARW
jgi:hypothetical protein